MKGLIFEALSPQADAVANRTDVACFIGFCVLRDVATPESLKLWLQHEGWWKTETSDAMQLGEATLYQVPLPIHSWEQFDQLFAWDQRDYVEEGGETSRGASYLGAAVRSFFVQGGRKCYVISCGEPLPFDADRTERDSRLLQLAPLGVGMLPDRSQWQGLQHLQGLPEVSFVALPDLSELTSSYHEEHASPLVIKPPEAQFVECSDAAALTQEYQVIHLAAPACTDSEYAIWGSVIRRAVEWISIQRRDIQLVASLPLPHQESSARENLLAFLHLQDWLTGNLESTGSIASTFLQLGYPWLQTGYAGDLPANIEPPEGVIIGLLARNALIRGTYRSATALAVQDLVDIKPRLSQSQRYAGNPKAPDQASPQSPLIDRVSLLGATPLGFRLLSDVTTSNDNGYRQANINRTIALVLRAARSIGETYVFETSGERLWRQIVVGMSDVLTALQSAGALAGRRPSDAFQVRCDRSTMTQQDIDNGRVIVQVMIHPAACIESMRIQLVLGEGGRVSLSVLDLEAA